MWGARLAAPMVALAASTGLAGEADVLEVRVAREGEAWRFDVLVEHADEGWEHYADRFEVVAADGTVLGVRTLYHPHVDEQPFRRSLAGVVIPEGIAEVVVRAHDSVHGFGGREVTVELER